MNKSNKFGRFKSSKEYTQCRKSCNALLALLTNKRLWAEYWLLQRMTIKIAIRIRNSTYSRSLRQLSKLTTDFKSLVERHPLDEIKLLLESQLEEQDNDQLNAQLTKHCNHFSLLSKKLFMVVTVSSKVFKLAQVWLDLGQLVSHFLIISCIASRLCIYGKALMVYLYDVNLVVCKLQRLCSSNSNQTKDRMKLLLHKLNIKLRPKLTKTTVNAIENTENLKEDIFKAESFMIIKKESNNDLEHDIDLGVPLDRATLRQQFTSNGLNGGGQNSKVNRRGKKRTNIDPTLKKQQKKKK